MNYAQFGMFMIFFFSVVCCGLAIYSFINREGKSFINGSVFLGEVLLLGSTLLVGELLLLSFVGLFKAPYLWGAVLLNYCFLFSAGTRKSFALIFDKKPGFDLPLVCLILLIAVFIFRNCYFLVDVDSHGGYLFTQKLWLSSGTSFMGDATFDARFFVPQFNAVPYSLGLSVFGTETLFAQLINTFWRLIVIILVYGYTAYYFNGYFGLGAAMFVLFNEHFFYSGANQYVIINGAVIAFYFAAAYNFWEARRKSCSFRFFLALVFLTQLPANKYQMLYNLLFLAVLGIAVQPDLGKRLKELFFRKEWLYCLAGACIVAALWPLKNLLITGNPFFPIFAGKFGTFNWTPELENIILKRAFYISPTKLFKFLSYLFIWPGVNVAKYAYFILIFLPLLMIRVLSRVKFDKDSLLGLCFWLGLSLLSIIGICFTGWMDPRAYRYPIAVLSFTTVLSLSYIFSEVFCIKNKIIIGGIIILLAVAGGRNEGIMLMFRSGGGLGFPDFKENVSVIFNRIHMDYAVKKHYPQLSTITKALGENKDKLKNLAWDHNSMGAYTSAFLLPMKSMVSLEQNAMIKWDSYKSQALIENDLRGYDIEWVITMDSGKVVFLSISDYAKKALSFDRYPRSTVCNYGFPEELYKISY